MQIMKIGYVVFRAKNKIMLIFLSPVATMNCIYKMFFFIVEYD